MRPSQPSPRNILTSHCWTVQSDLLTRIKQQLWLIQELLRDPMPLSFTTESRSALRQTMFWREFIDHWLEYLSSLEEPFTYPTDITTPFMKSNSHIQWSQSFLRKRNSMTPMVCFDLNGATITWGSFCQSSNFFHWMISRRWRVAQNNIYWILLGKML